MERTEMTVRNRGHQIVKRLKYEHGVSVKLSRDGSILLLANDSRGVGEEATQLARVFKRQIVDELSRKGTRCKKNA